MSIRELYQDKNKRDERYKELKAQDKRVVRCSTGAQQIHPQYIEDFFGPEKHDTGFGNTVYKTYFKNLYVVKEDI
jgi:hypothetical protein